MKSMNREGGKKIAVMAAILIGFMMIVFTPFASAAVTSFTVTPGTGLAGAVDSYDALVTTTGVTKINISIPAGFIAVAPTTGGVQIARVDFWNSSTLDYYGYCTITANNANPTTKVDVYCKFQVGGDEVEKTTTQNVDYTAGAENTFESGFASCTSTVRIKLPEEAQKGCINLTINCADFKLDDVMIAIRQFVRNPTTAGDYTFNADGVDETVTITAPEGRATVFRGGWWYFDTTGDHVCNILFAYGTTGDTPLIGDINQDGQDDAILFRDGYWYVDTDQSHTKNYGFWYGISTDIPLVGDINQDGKDDTIVVRDGYWYVDTDQSHTPNYKFWYGISTDIPLVGDTNQDGKADTTLFRDGYWYVDTDQSHTKNYGFWYGISTDIPLVGNIG